MITYSLIFGGLLTLAIIFIRAYKSFVIGQNSLEIVEIGRETLRRGSTLILNSSRLLPTSYQPLSRADTNKSHELVFVSNPERSQSFEEIKNVLRPGFVRSSFNDAERESLIRSDNAFILSEHRSRCSDS